MPNGIIYYSLSYLYIIPASYYYRQLFAPHLIRYSVSLLSRLPCLHLTFTRPASLTSLTSLTMTFIIIAVVISALLLLAASPVAFGSSSPVPLPTSDHAVVVDMVVTSCDDLATMDLAGVVGVLGVLDCDKPVVKFR